MAFKSHQSGKHLVAQQQLVGGHELRSVHGLTSTMFGEAAGSTDLISAKGEKVVPLLSFCIFRSPFVTETGFCIGP